VIPNNTSEQYGLPSLVDFESCVLCFVDLLSLVLSKKEIDVSLLTVLAMAGYSSLFESAF